MRKPFGDTIRGLAVKDKKIVMLTGDLGHGVFEELAHDIGKRFIKSRKSLRNILSSNSIVI